MKVSAKDFVNISKYGFCEGDFKVDSQAAAASAATVSLLFIIFMIALRWARRRHGSLYAYALKKKTDILRVVNKVLPPSDARWPEFFLTAFGLCLLAMFLSGIISSKEDYTFEHVYLDMATLVTLDLDHCTVRYKPAVNYPQPNRNLTKPKVLVTLVKDKLITLDMDVCSNHVTLTVVNARKHADKYTNYRCDIVIIVPESILLPGMIIKEHSTGYPSTVRAGPMDEDTPNFGLRFGPNQLHIIGDYFLVRLENVSAKQMHLDINHGSIIGKNLVTTDPAYRSTFKTKTADIVLTTSRMTSAFVKQKSNLVCLTAANNSLFVDDRRQIQCNFIKSNTVRRHSTTSFLSSFSSFRRSHLNYTVPVFNKTDMCPDAVTKKMDVPYIPGCTDTDLCRLSESEQCLCRPICDMIEPDKLCYDGICGVEGTCDVSGRCCRSIMQQYSTADMFPKANQPRDGASVDAILFPWMRLQLEQLWQMESETGQLTVTVLEDMTQQYRVSSYKLEKPTDFVEQELSIPIDSKDLIDKYFHPSGDVRPKEPIFEFNTIGPGFPERVQGSMFWYASTIYYGLSSAWLDTISVGIIKPSKFKIEVPFNPSFCPAFIADNDFFEQDRRLVLVREKLLDALEQHPPGGARKPLPPGSALVYKPTKGRPKGYRVDPQTNQIVVDLIDPEGNFVVIWAVVYSAAALAAAGALFVSFKTGLGLVQFLKQFRAQRIQEEEIWVNMMKYMESQKEIMQEERQKRKRNPGQAGHANDSDPQKRFVLTTCEEDADTSMLCEIYTYTDFFYVLEHFLGDSKKSADFPLRVGWGMQAFAACSLPLIVIWFFSSTWRSAVLDDACSVRADKDLCLAQTEVYSSAAQVFIPLSIVIFFLEVSAHYLRFSYGRARKVLRKVFYLFYALNFLGALFLLFLVCVWILLGVLILPSKALPYATALLGVGGNAVTIWANLRCFQLKVRHEVVLQIESWKPKLQNVPRPILDTVIRDQFLSALRQEGLTKPLMIFAMLQQIVILVIILAFVFIGFAAFTDVYQLLAGIFNTAIVALVCVAFHNQVRKDGNAKAAREQVFYVQQRLSNRIIHYLKMIHGQLQAAFKLYAKMHAENMDMASDASHTNVRVPRFSILHMQTRLNIIFSMVLLKNTEICHSTYRNQMRPSFLLKPQMKKSNWRLEPTNRTKSLSGRTRSNIRQRSTLK
jgi:hypothetical protein